MTKKNEYLDQLNQLLGDLNNDADFWESEEFNQRQVELFDNIKAEFSYMDFEDFDAYCLGATAEESIEEMIEITKDL